MYFIRLVGAGRAFFMETMGAGDRRAMGMQVRVVVRTGVEGRWQTREGDKVRFFVSDVFLPGPDDVFSALSAGTQLEGTVVSFSDSGSEPRVFAVVDVIRRQTVVVPVARLSDATVHGS